MSDPSEPGSQFGGGQEAYVYPTIDWSTLMPKLDVSGALPSAAWSTLMPTLGLDLSALFPGLDVSGLFPRVDFYALGATAIPCSNDSGSEHATEGERRSVIAARKSASQILGDREKAIMLTALVWVIVCIGLSLAVTRYPQVATIARITGADPFDIAMGFGALTFWLAYSRRRDP